MKDNNSLITFPLTDYNNYSRLHSSNEVKHFVYISLNLHSFGAICGRSLSLIGQQCSSGNKCQSFPWRGCIDRHSRMDLGCSGAELGQFSVWRSGIELYFLLNCWCRNYGLSSLSVNYKWTSKLRLILTKNKY